MTTTPDDMNADLTPDADHGLTAEEEAELEAELATFSDIQTNELGMGAKHHWVEPIHDNFAGAEKAHTTILFGGFTLAHDELVAASMRGLGYQVINLDCPDGDSLRFGKEFGNRGQCNPTYFTVGNLLKYLVGLRISGLTNAEIIADYVFVTAGACGPCRFGQYVTEYRKALRDAGFDGFRVLLFQQQGGLKQATGDEGLAFDHWFAMAFARALLVGDCLNLLAYRLRPYETSEGSVDAAVAECREILKEVFENRRNTLLALWKCRRILGRVPVDFSQPKPLVSVIGEFWAMTTEGDGNYHLQRFLESEGAEVDIQPIVNWLLYLVWDVASDTKERMELRQADKAYKGLEGKNPTKTLWTMKAADTGIRLIFQTYANILGLHKYSLPDMDHIADLAKGMYDPKLRGGEGHMEVGKLVHFVEDKVNHMTVSVKPFGCMPSSGVSDGVQSLVESKYPGALFLPIETTGDQAVNAHSRIQMQLFKAKQAALSEYEEALGLAGCEAEELTAEAEKTFRRRSRRWQRLLGPFFRPKHRVAGTAANRALM